MSVEYTDEQKAAIKAKGKVIVSASAGSGKTCIMVERILRLVTEGEASLLDVLAVTFTNKAAAQMKEKIREALLKEMKKQTGEKRERLKTELDLLPLAQISTVHSFCGKLIRTYFYLLPEEALSPDYRILSPEDAAGIKAKAYAAALEAGFQKGDEAFKRMLDVHYRNTKKRSLRSIIMKMYEKVRGLENSEEYLKRTGEDKFGEAVSFIAQDYQRKARAYKVEIEKVREKLLNYKTPQIICSSLLVTIDSLLALSSPFEMAQVNVDAPRMAGRPKEAGEDLDNYCLLSELKAGLTALVKELQENYTNEKEEREKCASATVHAAALAALCLDYGREYARLKREANALDYEDLEHFALALLRKEEVQAEVKKNYRYVYVDEYQDVNPMQESIVSAIAGENVFLVGDEKQAIYCFRGSRSCYFRAKRKEFGGAYPLNENFRSASKILQTVNEIFQGTMENYEAMNGGRLYEGNAGEIVSHAVSESKEAKPVRGVYSVMNAATAQKKCALAESIIEVIESEIGKEFYDIKQKCVREVDYGDIAVLVRSDKTDGKRIAAALTERKIPVTSSSSVDVCEFYEIKLLLDCLRFLDNAEADIPLAAVMLSNFGGFTDEDLMRVRLAYPAAPTFRMATRLYAYQQTDELSQRLNTFYTRAKRLRALAKVRSAAEMLCTLLSEGLEVEIAAQADGENCLKRVRRLIAEAENSGSVHDFLLRIKEMDEGLKLSESGGENAVKVMTMHRSKGLEFPVVILASMECLIHDSKPKEVVWSEKFLFSPRYYNHKDKSYSDTILRKATALERALEEEEGERNLLYVGMTRAMYRLHLMVSDRARPLSYLSYSRLSDYLGQRFRGEEGTNEPNPVLEAMKLSADYPYRDSVYLPQKSSATAMLKEQSKDAVAKGKLSSSTTDEGSAYHKFMQYYEFGKDPVQELARMKKAGLLKDDEAQYIKEEGLLRIAQIPCLKALAGIRCEREKKFLLAFTPKEAGRAEDEGSRIIYQGAIDLLFQDGEGYVIYDYKYSGQDALSLKKKYAPQIELYRDAVAKGKRVARGTIRAKIINIRTAEVIDM